jgi:hypothetical protein
MDKKRRVPVSFRKCGSACAGERNLNAAPVVHGEATRCNELGSAAGVDGGQEQGAGTLNQGYRPDHVRAVDEEIGGERSVAAP